MLADQHIHSSCSEDAQDSMLGMALASYKRGVSFVCFTDHCDLDNGQGGTPNPDYFSVRPKALEMFRYTLPKLPEELEARLGIEIGAGNHNPEKAREMSSFTDLDLVLGSIHNLRDTDDFYCIKYESEAHCRALMDLYADELIELSGMDFFDIIAHIGYTRRYMLRSGFDVHFDLEHYGDKIRKLLGILIQNGRGIELNCSGVRSESVLSPTPSMEILKLYRQMGGELITVGSDAHNVRSAGVNIPWGYEQLRLAGFKYVAVYKKRRPEMIRIED